VPAASGSCSVEAHVLQQVQCVAVEMIADVAMNDLGCGFELADRLVGMRDEVDERMNRVLRHARPTAPHSESSTLPWVTKENPTLS
jgi:hypothetical protein